MKYKFAVLFVMLMTIMLADAVDAVPRLLDGRGAEGHRAPEDDGLRLGHEVEADAARGGLDDEGAAAVDPRALDCHVRRAPRDWQRR